MQVGHCTCLVKFPRKYENSFQFVAAEENASEVGHRKWFLEKKKQKKHIPAVIVNFTPRAAKYDVPKLSSNAINLVMKDVQYQFLSIFFFILTSFLGKKKTNLLCKCISIQENNYTKKKLLPRLITSYKPSRYREIVQNYNTSFRLNHNH